MRGMLELSEDADFYFDEEAADRPCRFIEKFCAHFEGTQHAGRPFILHPIQRRIVRDLYGWKWRATKLRRFTDCYFEGAVGCGKSPLLAATGIYGLMADREPGAQVYSLASSYGQARVVFETAKKFVQNNRELARRLKVVDREIRHPASNSRWQIVSGKGPGAGAKPSLILGDEVHQWANAGAYQDLRDRMFKRSEPLLICATNAGPSRTSFCWQLREKAVAALAGTGDPTLYPVIWCADEDAATDDPAAWRAANPLIGVTMAEEKIAQHAAAAVKDPEEETNFRRLYMGIWPKAGAGQWIDLAAWDECEAETPEAAAPPKDAPLYVALDLAMSDDLCAAVYVWPTPERFHVDAHFWLPRVTADRYQEQHAVPYGEWAKAGHLTLLEEPTVSLAARVAIAAAVIKAGKRHPIRAVCYDAFNAEQTVKTLEAAGLTCVPIRQGFSVSPGCYELDRRLKERSLLLSPNPVLRFNAENAEGKTDDRGNLWVAKPQAAGKYAGTRWKKVDGITALVTALTEARKHSFPAAQTQWRGKICTA